MGTIWYTSINEWTAQECYDLQICYQSLMKHSQLLGVNVYFYMLDSSILYLMCFRNTTPCKHFHELQYGRSTKEYSNY